MVSAVASQTREGCRFDSGPGVDFPARGSGEEVCPDGEGCRPRDGEADHPTDVGRAVGIMPPAFRLASLLLLFISAVPVPVC